MKSILFFRVFLVLLLISSSVNSQERPLEQEKKAAGMSELEFHNLKVLSPGLIFVINPVALLLMRSSYLMVRICLIGRVSMEEKRNGLFMKEFLL